MGTLCLYNTDGKKRRASMNMKGFSKVTVTVISQEAYQVYAKALLIISRAFVGFSWVDNL